MEPIVPPPIEAYAEANSSPEPEHLQRVAEETRRLSGDAQMMVGQLEGRFLKMLVAMLRPQRVLEIGTFTGYSSLSMAEALPEGGRIITLEVDPRHEEIARRHIEASPYANRIEIRMGPALETLQALEGPFDFVFIDADKGNYRNYYEAVLPMLSEQGVVAVDNVLWSGQVLDPAAGDHDAPAIVEFNAHVRNDPRVECVILTVRDGVTLIRKR
jgi:predicted O-methyltransferase YrrM